MMWYDLVTLAILLLATIRGAAKGFVWQVAGIAAIVLCFMFAESLSQPVAPILNDLGVDAPLDRWLAMFLIYVALSLVVFFIARMLKDIIEKIRLVEYDRHLGALFGLLKGAIFCLVLTFFFVTLSPSAQTSIRGSYSGKAAAIVMDRMHAVLPEEIHDVLEPYIHRLDTPDLNLQNSHSHDGQSENPSQNADDVELVVIEKTHVAEDESGKGVQNKTASPTMPDRSSPNRSELVRAIAVIYTDSSSASDALIEEIDSILTGIPDNVATAVLYDWLTDLTKTASDPDPGTDETSSLNQRIIRQLTLLRIDLNMLSDSWQSRFQNAARQ
jgi:uncharacterized membrane protein required for colicin V production